jgi:hypothetical protein
MRVVWVLNDVHKKVYIACIYGSIYVGVYLSMGALISHQTQLGPVGNNEGCISFCSD